MQREGEVFPARRRLPNRRMAVTEEITAADGRSIVATVGFDAAGRPAELFLSGAKDGTDMAAIYDDVAVTISVALQHGVGARALAHSVSPGKASPIGAALELIAAFEPEAVPAADADPRPPPNFALLMPS
jgi:hypothetical protein